MGGEAGIRGYYYQVLGTLIEFVDDASWDSVKIEPSTEDDKVDIEWVFSDHIRCVQVKSSINNFERGDLIKWIYMLVTDAQNTYGIFGLEMKYTLYLIGTTDPTADKWISDFRGGRLELKATDKLYPISRELPKVEVTKHNFDIENLQAIAFIRMQEYLEKNGRHAKLENIKSLCAELVNKLFTFSVQKRPLTKTLFLQLIGKHIDNEIYGVEKHQTTGSDLTLVFFEKGKLPEGLEMKSISLEESPYVLDLLSSARNNVQKIKDIKLPKKSVDGAKPDIQEEGTFDSPRSELIKQISQSESGISHILKSKDGYIPVTIPEQEKTDLKRLAKRYLEIELDDEDFNLGGLEKRIFPTYRMFSGPSNIPRGEDNEIEKYTAYVQSLYYLTAYQYLKYEYFPQIESYRLIPLILKNIGTIVDSGINVTLEFPQNVRVVTPERFKVPLTDNFIEDFIKDDSLFNVLITPTRDYRVQEFDPLYPKMPEITIPTYFPSEKKIYIAENLIKHLNSLFYYEHFEEQGCDVVKYEFKSLQPSCSMAFPTFLLVETQEDFSFEYHITSNHLKKAVQGTLHWKR